MKSLRSTDTSLGLSSTSVPKRLHKPDRSAREELAVRILGRKSELTVGEASKIVGVSPTTIRVWEHYGLVSSRRSPSGYRYFGPNEIARIRRIAFLRTAEKLNTPGIKRVLEEESVDRRGGPRTRTEIELGPALRRIRLQKGLTLERAGPLA